MAMDEGAAGADNLRLDNFDDFLKLFPQPDVYKTRTLSPANATSLDVKVTISFCDVNAPESIDIEEDNAPMNDQTYPVAAPDVVVAKGRFGAMYLYFLAPQTLV
jgi:hypothetical protein